ncbi:MAG: transporter substrate-binding domain-containing protein [Alphaproteobacteria bacterium]|nr:transporter substrate-binding domain-containing protein [Alphaproteobacteria bacterium]
MKNISLFLAAIVIALGSVWIHDKISPQQQVAQQETAYDRVMRTKTLRCGYADWPPIIFTKDPITGKFSGIAYDLTEELGKRLGLKIDWAEDTGWTNAVSSIQTKRVDAFCVFMCVNTDRGRYVAYSRPIFFNATYPYVRNDDHRFDADLLAANSPDVRFSTIDGEMTAKIAHDSFPKAKTLSIPSTVQVSEALNNVATSKADIIITDYGFGEGYIKNNPNTLRRLSDDPFQVFQTSYAFDIHESQLREMIDNALIEMQNQGIVDQIIDKHSSDPKEIIRPALPYRK